MPAMTLNQIKMVLNIAGMYGAADRPGAGGRAGGRGGPGLRLPGVWAGGWSARCPGSAVVMRMVTAYAATMAVGLGAVAYFEKGAPASTSKVIALAGSLRR